MATRGCYGFYKKGIAKVSYNHSDSYPSGLGQDIVRFINSTSIKEMNEIFNNIEMVNEDEKPTDEQLVELKLTNKYDGKEKDFDWYSVLRNIQGDLSAYKKNERFMIDNQFFIYSRSCQYAYIINLDNNSLEIYVGVQSTKCKGRYGTKQSEYYPKLIKKFPLSGIPSDWLTFVEKKVG